MPLTLALLIISAPVPEFESVTLCVVVVPVLTLPKLSKAELRASTGVLTATPVPESATLAGETLALLEIETDPTLLPAAVGSKLTASGVLWPGLSVRGKERAEIV